jgi:hypothetical protein
MVLFLSFHLVLTIILVDVWGASGHLCVPSFVEIAYNILIHGFRAFDSTDLVIS